VYKAPRLISGVIERTSGMTEEASAIQKLFTLFGIKNYRWDKHADGLTFGAFGLWLSPRDMARIGKMRQQDGVWENRMKRRDPAIFMISQDLRGIIYERDWVVLLSIN
jgi:hypothetical protein